MQFDITKGVDKDAVQPEKCSCQPPPEIKAKVSERLG